MLRSGDPEAHAPDAEGHYLRGYGDRTEQVLKLSPITLLPGAADEAQKWLDEHPDGGTVDRIGAVIDLVSGFAPAYGVELLATAQSMDPEVVTDLISCWNQHKGDCSSRRVQLDSKLSGSQLSSPNVVSMPVRYAIRPASS